VLLSNRERTRNGVVFEELWCGLVEAVWAAVDNLTWTHYGPNGPLASGSDQTRVLPGNRERSPPKGEINSTAYNRIIVYHSDMHSEQFLTSFEARYDTLTH
jgi:hypothetical protein